MSIDTTGILAALESHATASGHFERVNLTEVITQPGSGISAAIWPQAFRPYPAGSGLAATTGRLEFLVRVMSPALVQPSDSIDPTLIAAVDALMAAYSGDFQLGGLVRDVDLQGATGEPLSWRAGWLPLADGAKARIVDITVPLIVNDLYVQNA